MTRKNLNYDTVRALAKMGLSQGSIAAMCNYTEHSFSTRKMNDPLLQAAISEGRSELSIELQEALTNRAFGPAKWEKDPIKRAHEIGLKWRPHSWSHKNVGPINGRNQWRKRKEGESHMRITIFSPQNPRGRPLFKLPKYKIPVTVNSK